METLPKRLYHGTNLQAAQQAIVHGLMPRKLTGRNNWKHTVGSNPNAVYLTTGYAAHFAAAASKDDSYAAIIEIDTEALHEHLFVADEDAIEQYMRGKDGLPADWDMKRRTMHYRRRAAQYNPLASLELLGTVGYADIVPPHTMRRMLVLSPEEMTRLLIEHFDGSVNVVHHQIAGGVYANNVRWLFGDAEYQRMREALRALFNAEQPPAAPERLGTIHQLQQQRAAATACQVAANAEGEKTC